MRGSAFSFLAIAAVAGGAFHGKGDHDFEQRQIQYSRDLAKNQKSKKNPDEDVDPVPKSPKAERDPDLKRAEELIVKGSLDDAQAIYKGMLQRELAAQDHSEAEQGLGIVQLYRSLADIVAEHPFAEGKELWTVTLPKKRTVIARIIGDRKAKKFTLKLLDGRRLEVERARVSKMEPITERSFRSGIEKEYKTRIEEIGGKPNPVELYRRIVIFCLEFRLRELAFGHLKTALEQPSGGVLIDLFCDGDTRELHRSRLTLAGFDADLMDFGPEPVLAKLPERPDPIRENPDPKPESAPDPKPVPEAKPRPRPRVIKKSKSRLDELQKERKWLQSDSLYRRGLAVYRQSLKGASAAKFKAIKQGRELFEKAQELIFELSEKYEDEPALERRAVEIQQLIYDCIKRQKI